MNSFDNRVNKLSYKDYIYLLYLRTLINTFLLVGYTAFNKWYKKEKNINNKTFKNYFFFNIFRLTLLIFRLFSLVF